MLRRVGISSVFLVWIFASTCNPDALQIQARLANSVAVAGNRSLPLLVDAYRAEGTAIITRARAEGADRAEAERRLAAHVVTWRPVWGDCDATGTCLGGAWPSLRAAHAAWSSTLEAQIAGEPFDLARATRHAEEMRAAYCQVRASIPAAQRSVMPQIPGLPCATP